VLSRFLEALSDATPSAAANANPFRFEAFYYDSGVKTYDMRARPYRPEIGRFLAEDRFESGVGDFNLAERSRDAAPLRVRRRKPPQ
jgi:RHS repeat-associated protein